MSRSPRLLVLLSAVLFMAGLLGAAPAARATISDLTLQKDACPAGDLGSCANSLDIGLGDSVVFRYQLTTVYTDYADPGTIYDNCAGVCTPFQVDASGSYSGGNTQTFYSDPVVFNSLGSFTNDAYASLTFNSYGQTPSNHASATVNVPEPSSTTLLGAGLLGVLALAALGTARRSRD